jgi:hypothetical protein
MVLAMNGTFTSHLQVGRLRVCHGAKSGQSVNVAELMIIIREFGSVAHQAAGCVVLVREVRLVTYGRVRLVVSVMGPVSLTPVHTAPGSARSHQADATHSGRQRDQPALRVLTGT